MINDFKLFMENNNIEFNDDLIKNFEASQITKELTAKWYKSLADNNPDYTIYDDDYFLYASLDCYKKYSSKYIKMLFKNAISTNLIKACKNIVDMGNGLGYSTLLIKQLLNDENISVYGNNIINTLQYKYNAFLNNDMLILDNQQIDCFIFFDFMEHIENPIEYIENLINIHKPKLLIFANSFNTYCIGHFENYKDKNNVIEQKKISRLFNKAVRNKGYAKIECKFWNNRPMVFSLGDGLEHSTSTNS